MPAHAPPAARLDEAAIERLSDLLDRRAVPFKGLNLEALDGFLTALAVSPSPVPVEEWEPVVWGGRSPSWDDDAEEAGVRRLLMGHWAMAQARVRHGTEDLPDDLAPLMWLPEDPGEGEALDEDETALDVGADWAHGFFTAVMLREAEWDRWLDENHWIDELFDALDRLASGEALDPGDPTAAPMAVGYRERLGIILGIPDMMADLNHHRVHALTPRTPLRRDAAPGRNDPCPCGSGKKYKKCCGAE